MQEMKRVKFNIVIDSDMARAKRNWDAEWGRPGLEGNIWWLGGRRQNWEAVMGKNIWWWFCE